MRKDYQVDVDSDSDLDSVERELLKPVFLSDRKQPKHPKRSSDETALSIESNRGDDTGKDSVWLFDSDSDDYRFSRDCSQMPDFRIPSSLYNNLYQHQKDGVRWMAGLHVGKIGGLLGDDMGKTMIAKNASKLKMTNCSV